MYRRYIIKNQSGLQTGFGGTKKTSNIHHATMLYKASFKIDDG